jgi:hypothetical protein
MSRKSNRIPLLFLPRARACHQAGHHRASMLRVPLGKAAADAFEGFYKSPNFGPQTAAMVRDARRVLRPWIESMRADGEALAARGVDPLSPYWKERNERRAKLAAAREKVAP